MIGFKEFCDEWVRIYKELKAKGASDTEIGNRFEEHFLNNVLISFIPKGYRTARNTSIKDIEYEFDFLVLKRGASEYYVTVSKHRAISFSPSDVLAALEVKSHGFFNHECIETVKNAFRNNVTSFPQIKPFYVTFKETNYYDKEARNSFGSNATWYYRLADSGDGVQIPPKSYFPNEWKRLMEGLSVLKSI